MTGVLASACAGGLACVASESVVEGFDAPAWVRTVPDQPSPLLIAEAVLASLDTGPDEQALGTFRSLHDPACCARLLCEALGIAD